MPRQRIEHQVQHGLAVGHRVLLGPVHRLHVVIEMFCTLREICKVTVRQLDHPALHVLAGQLDEVVGNRIADTPAARVQHHPHLIRLIQANLDEVIPTTEGTHLVGPL